MADMNRDKRPLSPHLTIYRPQWTSMTSIFTRLTGNALIVGALLIVWWFSALASGPEAYARANGFMTSWFGDLVMFFVACIALYWSYETVHISAKFGSVTDGLRISKVWFLMAVPLGFALIVWRLLQSFVRDFRSLRDGTPVYQGDTLFD